MNQPLHILQPYKGPASRHTCPVCGQRHKFSRYIDRQTGQELADHVGRCDRENNCGYHYTPKQFFDDNPDKKTREKPAITAFEKKPDTQNAPVDYLPFSVMDQSVQRHRSCSFYIFLSKLFGEEIACKLCHDYFIGANREGLTVFWQVDFAGRIRQAKVMQYDPVTGKRNKETGAFFAGKKILGNNEANLQQCFFGEYLLLLPDNECKPVAIVESEKTAVIASVYFPDFIWLATGGKNGAKWTEARVCSVLKGKSVILFPDLGAFEQWHSKGLLIAATAGCKVAISDLLERNSTEEEKREGLDLADFLLRVQDSSNLAMTDFNYPVIWDYARRKAAV